jgi:hypothetical protein
MDRITIDEAEKILDEVAAGLPEKIFEELNGGIVLLPEAVLDPQSRKGADLYILGEYHSGGGLGRYISPFTMGRLNAYSGTCQGKSSRESLKSR